MTDTPLIDEPEETDLLRKNRRAWLWVCFAVILVFAALFWARSFSQETIIRPSSETESSAYAAILSEPRTGVRLALLDDFMTEYPQSTYLTVVRNQRRALKTHEQAAWAALTDELYRVNLSPEDKAQAISTYVREWGQLSRAAQLSALNEYAPPAETQAMKFKTPASPYKKGGSEHALAGARPDRVRRPVPAPAPPPIVQREEVLQVTQARVRSARRPVYPRRARRKGITAEVTLSLEIDARGRVTSSTVVAISATRYEKDFIKAAQKAAKRSRFHPKTIGERSVPSHGFLRKYTFNFDD